MTKTNERRKQASLEAIKSIFGDTSVPMHETIEVLEEIREEIDDKLMTCKGGDD